MKRHYKVEEHTYIKSRTALHISPKDIYNELNGIYGHSVTVCRWAKKFKGWLSVIKDGHRSGRPKSSVTDKHVAAVKALVEEDDRYTVKDMANSVGISEGSVHEILSK
ncbi:protein GVQW3-like [Ruditapes philippinarum]|uniref:protein GVQW3-like n=1 Tax=Ruditapes philippinarum TaxID=129788 RepID=UPI00295C0B4F|nr:protein GVQW3-like [Ruditapes philippinarum]